MSKFPLEFSAIFLSKTETCNKQIFLTVIHFSSIDTSYFKPKKFWLEITSMHANVEAHISATEQRVALTRHH